MDTTKRDDLAAALLSVWPPAAKMRKIEELVDTRTGTVLTEGQSRELQATGGIPLKRKLELVPDSKVFVGGGGVVIQCRDAKVKGVLYALKIPRLSLFVDDANRSDDEIAKFEREYAIQLGLSHPNIAKVYETGTVLVPKSDAGRVKAVLPYLLLEWVEGESEQDGPMPLHEYLLKRAPSTQAVLDVVLETLRGLDHLHNAGFIHWDIKSDNVLVDRTGTPKIMDLGNAKDFEDPAPDSITVETSRRNLPRNLFPLIESRRDGSPGSLNRISLSLENHGWFAPRVDLYMLGREINRVIRADCTALTLDVDSDLAEIAATDVDASTIASDATIWEATRRDTDADSFDLKCLSLVTRRMLATESTPYYDTARAVANEMERITPAFGAANSVRELQTHPQRVIRIPPNLNAPWTDRIDRIANAPLMRRLDQHRQLATVHLVYAGAQHTRWEHSLGVYEATIRYLQALYADRTNPFFRLGCTLEDVEATLLSAILHDLGHVATGHQVEESILTQNLRHESYLMAVLAVASEDQDDTYLTLLRDRYPINHTSAKRDAERLIEDLVGSWSKDTDAARTLLRRVRLIMKPRAAHPTTGFTSVTNRGEARVMMLEILGSIVSGGMDADRFDYLRRDSHHCGVEYGQGIDELRFFQSLTAVPGSALSGQASNGEAARNIGATIGVTPKGQHPLDSMILARHHMFSAVYWQHTVRALTAMLKRAVEFHVTALPDPTDEVQAQSDERIDLLIERFRELPDETAIDWLEEKIREDALAQPDAVSVAAGAAVATDICSALRGDRTLFYWTILEIWSQTARDTEHKRLQDAVYWRAIEQAESHGTNASDQTTRVSLTSAWMEKLANDLVSRIVPGDPPTVRPGELLLDIPTPGTDQIDDLVIQAGGPHFDVHPLAAVSPLGAATKEAFERSVRRVRVFVHPRLARRLLAHCSEHELSQHALKCLEWDLGIEIPLPILPE